MSNSKAATEQVEELKMRLALAAADSMGGVAFAALAVDELEQAIAATMGSGTCENANSDGYGFRFECSECGYSAIVNNCAARLDELPNFCPNCGRKVVSA